MLYALLPRFLSCAYMSRSDELAAPSPDSYVHVDRGRSSCHARRLKEYLLGDKNRTVRINSLISAYGSIGDYDQSLLGLMLSNIRFLYHLTAIFIFNPIKTVKIVNSIINHADEIKIAFTDKEFCKDLSEALYVSKDALKGKSLLLSDYSLARFIMRMYLDEDSIIQDIEQINRPDALIDLIKFLPILAGSGDRMASFTEILDEAHSAGELDALASDLRTLVLANKGIAEDLWIRVISEHEGGRRLSEDERLLQREVCLKLIDLLTMERPPFPLSGAAYQKKNNIGLLLDLARIAKTAEYSGLSMSEILKLPHFVRTMNALFTDDFVHKLYDLLEFIDANDTVGKVVPILTPTITRLLGGSFPKIAEERYFYFTSDTIKSLISGRTMDESPLRVLSLVFKRYLLMPPEQDVDAYSEWRKDFIDILCEGDIMRGFLSETSHLLANYRDISTEALDLASRSLSWELKEGAVQLFIEKVVCSESFRDILETLPGVLKSDPEDLKRAMTARAKIFKDLKKHLDSAIHGREVLGMILSGHESDLTEEQRKPIEAALSDLEGVLFLIEEGELKVDHTYKELGVDIKKLICRGSDSKYNIKQSIKSMEFISKLLPILSEASPTFHGDLDKLFNSPATTLVSLLSNPETSKTTSELSLLIAKNANILTLIIADDRKNGWLGYLIQTPAVVSSSSYLVSGISCVLPSIMSGASYVISGLSGALQVLSSTTASEVAAELQSPPAAESGKTVEGWGQWIYKWTCKAYRTLFRQGQKAKAEIEVGQQPVVAACAAAGRQSGQSNGAGCQR